MARKVRDSSLESRASRAKLKVRGKPYYRVIGEGLHLGYRKGERGGKWVMRRYFGNQNYVVETIATALQRGVDAGMSGHARKPARPPRKIALISPTAMRSGIWG